MLATGSAGDIGEVFQVSGVGQGVKIDELNRRIDGLSRERTDVEQQLAAVSRQLQEVQEGSSRRAEQTRSESQRVI